MTEGTSPVYSGDVETAPADEDIGTLHTSLGRQLGATAAQTLAEGPTAELSNLAQIQGEKGVYQEEMESGQIAAPDVSIYSLMPPLSPEVPIADAQKRVKDSGLAGAVKLPDQPTIRQGALDLMINHARTQAQREDVIQRGPQGFIPSALDDASSLFVSAVDPLNIAAFSIPVMGEARYGYLLEKAGSSVIARAGVRAGVGAAQGIAGSAILAPLEWAAKTEEGQDFTFSDMLAGMIQTAGAGAIFHAGLPLIAESYRKARGRPIEAAPLSEPPIEEPPLPGPEAPIAPAAGAPEAAAPIVAPEGVTPALKVVAETYFDDPVSEAPGPRLTAVENAMAHHSEEEVDRALAAGGKGYVDAQGNFYNELAGQKGEAPGEAVSRETPVQPSPMAQAFDALPDRVKEDLAHIANADLIAGRPVQGMEVLQAAAATDPRVAQALEAFSRDPSAQEVFQDVRAKLIATGMDADQATANATVWAARYSARASRLGTGNAMDLYKAEGVEIGQGASALEGRSFNQPVTAPTFHSGVERAVTNAKIAKGSPEQWAATLRNTPGVKPEEMKWLGLEDWLKEQGKSVSKEEVAQYVNDNNIQVNEVVKGEPPPPLTTEEQALAESAVAKINAGAKFLPAWLKQGEALDLFGVRPTDVVHWREQGVITPEEAAALDRSILVKYGETDQTKYPSYALPGGENYRELLLTLPPKEGAVVGPKGWGDTAGGTYDSLNYRSPHWDEPNILAHIRFDDRTVDGEKALHIAEVQSDWHQEGRRKGYLGQETEEHARLTEERTRLADEVAEIQHAADRDNYRDYSGDPEWLSRMDRITEINEKLKEPFGVGSQVPDAPFKTSWPELSMKRMIRYAAEHGYDRITWDTGETSAERYDLSKHIREITVVRRQDGGTAWWPKSVGGVDMASITTDASGKITKAGAVWNDAVGKNIDEVVGKDVAKRGMESKEKETKLTGVDLKVGGEGMKGFYDKILPAAVAKLTKKFGGKVEEAKLSAPSDEHEYKGPVPTADQLEHLRKLSSGTGNTKISPVTGKPIDFAIERVAVNSSIRAIMGDMARGESFGDAMVKHGSSDVAEIFGGEIARKDAENAVPVHSLKITPEMKRAALSEGFPLFQEGAAGPALRGRITLEDNRAIINLFEHADASTFLHESAHLWLDELARDAEVEGTSKALKDDFQTILQWLGADKAEDISVAQHEQFAQGFEQYLASGRAPSTALERAFAAFKNWLTAIYRDLAGLGAPITDDVRGVFDRMLTPEERQQIERASPPRRRGNAANLVSQPQTLIGFLKSRGGLKDNPEFAGRDYRASYPGLINNRRGMGLDEAREAAAEAGYLGADREAAMAETTPRDFLDALENHPHYRAGDEDRVAAYHAHAEYAEYRRTIAKEKANLEEYLARHGLPPISDEAMTEAANLLASQEEHSFDNALERAEIMLYNRDIDEEARHAASETGQGTRQQPAAAGRPGGGPGQAGPAPGPRNAVPDPRQAVRDAEWRRIAERSRAAAGDTGADGLGGETGAATDRVPASIDTPDKQLSALDASLKEAEDQWKAVEPYLDESDRQAINEAMINAGVDEEGKAEALRDLLNCLIVAEE